MVKIGSKKPKPEVGMELSVTFSMPPDSTVEQCSEVLCNFSEAVSRLANELGVVWVKLTMTGLPEELEPKLLAAKEAYDAEHPGLRLVIDNTK